MSGGDGEQDDAEAAAVLERFRATLRSVAVWEDPPADLGDRIVAQVNSLRAGDRRPVRAPRRRRRRAPAALDDERRRRRGGGWLWPALPWLRPPSSPSLPVRCSRAATTTSASVEPVADVELLPTELGGGGIGRRQRRRRRGRLRHQHRRHRPAASAGGAVLRGLAARRRQRRLGQRRHLPHARRRRPSRAVVGRPDRSLPAAGRHVRGRGLDRRARRRPPRRPAPAAAPAPDGCSARIASRGA